MSGNLRNDSIDADTNSIEPGIGNDDPTNEAVITTGNENQTDRLSVQIDPAVQQLLREIFEKLKFTIPLLILLLLKCALDNLVCSIILFGVLYSIYWIRNQMDHQISLKSRFNPKVLINLSLITASIFSAMVLFSSLLGYEGSILYRLVFIKPITAKSSFLCILWRSLVGDCAVQLISLFVKIILNLMMNSPHILQSPFCRALSFSFCEYQSLVFLFKPFIIRLICCYRFSA